jgi:hypothetical protein
VCKVLRACRRRSPVPSPVGRDVYIYMGVLPLRDGIKLNPISKKIRSPSFNGLVTDKASHIGRVQVEYVRYPDFYSMSKCKWRLYASSIHNVLLAYMELIFPGNADHMENQQCQLMKHIQLPVTFSL